MDAQSLEVTVVGPPQCAEFDTYWFVRVKQPSGKAQEYRCTTELQAMQFAELWLRASD